MNYLNMSTMETISEVEAGSELVDSGPEEIPSEPDVDKEINLPISSEPESTDKLVDKRLAMTSTTKSVFLTTVTSSHISSPHSPPGHEEDEDALSSLNSTSGESESGDEDVAQVEAVDLKTYEETPKWRRNKLPWTAQPEVHSDEYDTDLEEDFPPGKCSFHLYVKEYKERLP